MEQEKLEVKYRFKVEESDFVVPSLDRKKYALNKIKNAQLGIDLKEGLTKGLLKIDANNIPFFREQRMTMTEVTLFPLLSALPISFTGLEKAAQAFMKKQLDPTADTTSQYRLLKTFLEVCGWGQVMIELEDDRLVQMKITSYPLGLQKDNDQGGFIDHYLSGLLATIVPDCKVHVKRKDPSSLLIQLA